MHIRIEQIKEEGQELAFEFEAPPAIFPVLSEIISREECNILSPIKTTLRAIRIDDMIAVKGLINTLVRLSCGRCLKEYETPLHSRFNLTYMHRLSGSREGEDQDEVEISAAQTGLIYFEGDDINLQDGIQEQVILALPVKALCNSHCKGLCPRCGADLNAGECGCNRRPADNRFAVLKNLKLVK